jgi:steroid 5-alpha reductase family enzyme
MVSNSGLPFDEFGYAFTWLVTVVMQLSFFAVAYGCGFDLVTDFAGSTNFVLIAWLSFGFGPGKATRCTCRPLVVTVLLTLTRLYLAVFLLYRVIKRKKDARFDETRNSCVRFFVFWVLQMLWAWTTSLTVIYANSLVDVGETSSGDILLAAIGVWSVCRHPNYFGEIAMWWGIWIVASPFMFNGENAGAAWVTVASPLFTMAILLFLSGLPTAEGASLERYYRDPATGKRWDEYREKVSPIIPVPCGLYVKVPLILKRILFFEFPFLEYAGSMQNVTGGEPSEGVSSEKVGNSCNPIF